MLDILERQHSLEILEAALERVGAGTGQFVLVSGEAGIGKTTLVEHFVGRHQSASLTLRGYCDPLLTPSVLAPLRDFARDLGGALVKLIDDEAGTSTIFPQFLELLGGSALPPVLLVEDIHWADEATIDLLKFIARRLDTLSILLIATFRDDEVDNHRALQFLLGDLATLRAVHRVELARLSRDAVAVLAADSARNVDELYRQTGGNPFYVTEVIGSGADGVPTTVRDAVLGRAAQLRSNGRRLLDLAAIIGVRADYALLEEFPEVSGSGLQECLAVGLLQARDDGAAFRHELARGAVLEAIDPVRRRALSRDVLAAAVRIGFAQDGKYARLSHYAESAGSAGDVVTFGTAAGRSAAALGAHREAASHFRSVLRFSGGRSAQERAAANVDYARECAIVDWLAEAIDAYREAAALWAACGDRIREGETLSSLAWPLVRHGANAESDAAARQAIALLEPLGPSRELAEAYRTQAHLRMLDRDSGAAVRIGRRAIAMAVEMDRPSTLASAEMVVGTAMLVAGDPAGRPHVDRCIDIARARGLDEIVALARMNLGSAYGEQYLFADAEAELIEGLAFTRAHDLDHSGHYMSSWLGLTQVFQGRWSEASELCLALLAQPSLSSISRIMALVALGRVRTRRGDPGAEDVLDDALSLARKTSTLQRLAPIRAARAELAWFNGDPATVAAEARAVLDLAIDRRHAWHTGEFLFWLRRSGEAVRAPDWVAPPYAAQIAGDWRGAADLWRARGCRFEEARALAQGDDEARLRALEIFDSLGAAPAGAALRRDMRASGMLRIPRGPRASTLGNPFGLTTREMETLSHIVQGNSNARIAEVLFISTKTVDHHVSSILHKLGASTRAEAADIARREDILPQNGEGRRAK